MKYAKNLVLLAAALIAFSCEKEDCGDPVGEGGALLLIDEQGQRLVGEDKAYLPEDVYFLINGQRHELLIRNGVIIMNPAYLYNNGGEAFNTSDHVLYLSSSETDTVRMAIVKSTNECFTTYSISEFSYNGSMLHEADTSYQGSPLYVVVK